MTAASWWDLIPNIVALLVLCLLPFAWDAVGRWISRRDAELQARIDAWLDHP